MLRDGREHPSIECYGTVRPTDKVCDQTLSVTKLMPFAAAGRNSPPRPWIWHRTGSGPIGCAREWPSFDGTGRVLNRGITEVLFAMRHDAHSMTLLGNYSGSSASSGISTVIAIAAAIGPERR